MGSALPQWKHGRWSKYLPEALAAKFREGLEDPELMQLRLDTALIDAALTDYADRLKKGKGLNYRQRKELMDLTEQRRKLIESDARRQRELTMLVPVEKVMQLVAALATVHQELMPKELLPTAQARMRQLLMVHGATIELPKEGEPA